MSVTEAMIAELLQRLEALLKQIAPLRTDVDQLEQGLAQAQREYEEKVSAANAETDRLEGEKFLLLARSQGVRPPAPPPVPSAVAPVAPPPVFASTPEVKVSALPTLPENPRTKRKRFLLDYIFNFTDQGAEIEKINALMDDDRRDTGDMLELLAWGDIWKTKTTWETLDDQWRRLDEWRAALEQRLAYWTEESTRLTEDERYGLWQRKSELNEAGWQALLDEMLRKTEADNKRLAAEVAKMKEESQQRPAASAEVDNG